MSTKKPATDPLSEILKEAEEPSVPQGAAQSASQEMAAGLKKQAENYQDLKKAELVEVSMSPMYAPYFGEVMTVGLNGLNIYFPVNGLTYKVPSPYAAIIKRRQRLVDDQIQRNKKLSDVTANKEQSAGQMELIPR